MLTAVKKSADSLIGPHRKDDVTKNGPEPGALLEELEDPGHEPGGESLVGDEESLDHLDLERVVAAATEPGHDLVPHFGAFLKLKRDRLFPGKGYLAC